jgi:hypothetical protein
MELKPVIVTISRIATVEVVFGEGSHESVAAENEGERFENRALTGAVRSEQYRLSFTEFD